MGAARMLQPPNCRMLTSNSSNWPLTRTSRPFFCVYTQCVPDSDPRPYPCALLPLLLESSGLFRLAACLESKIWMQILRRGFQVLCLVLGLGSHLARYLCDDHSSHILHILRSATLGFAAPPARARTPPSIFIIVSPRVLGPEA